MKNLYLSLSLLVIITSCKTVKQQEQKTTKESVASLTNFNNPIITDKYTADPAAMVYKDKVYLYTGHDVPEQGFNFYRMNDWLVFSSSDMVHWEEHPVPLKVSDFAWSKGDAWASQVIELLLVLSKML